MSQATPAGDAAGLSDLASIICRILGSLDAWRNGHGPSAPPPPPHLLAEVSSMCVALTRLNFFLNKTDNEHPAWIIDCTATVLRAIDTNTAQYTATTPSQNSDIERAVNSTEPATVSDDQRVVDNALAISLRPRLQQLIQAFELCASANQDLREQALDLRIAIEQSSAQIVRSEDRVGAAPSNRNLTRPSPAGPQGPSTMDEELEGSGKAGKTSSWRPSFRQRSGKSGDENSRSSRTASIMTTSSSSSARTASTAASALTASSRTTLSTVSDYSDHRRVDSTDPLRDKQNIDRPGGEAGPSESRRPSLATLHRHTDSSATISDRPPNIADTLVLRPRSEGKAQEVLGLRRTETAKQMVRPSAEVEMSSGKYQGYWRANFATSIPAAAAISAVTILATAIPTGGERALTVTPELTERAAIIRDSLDTVTSAQDAMQVLQTADLAALVFTMRCSLDEGKGAEVPSKTALQMYQKIEEMGGMPHKAAKAWQAIAKLLKKFPEQTLVYLLFLVHIGRRLQGRKITIDQKPAVVFLLQKFWPDVGPKTDHKTAGAAISAMLLDHFEEIPEELPVGLEAVRYEFKSGGRGDLLSLISSNRNIIEKKGK